MGSHRSEHRHSYMFFYLGDSPYVVNLESTAEIWLTLQTRFQSTNSSKVTQLKNELHNVSLKNSTMTQYLSEIKSLVDQIAVAGSTVDTEYIILYILKGLPPSYQSFKTVIQTMLTPISLDQLYPLLLSEEINLAFDTASLPPANDPSTALVSYRGRGRRTRTKNYANQTTTPRSTTPAITCQIKKGHSAQIYWHRLNTQYVPPAKKIQNTALVASSDNLPTNWYLDYDASLHLTNSLETLSLSAPYQGFDSITIGDGRSVNIAHPGSGLLPTPSRKLYLSNILHTPSF
ncbi:hypothetical protein KFK09_024809 [Dendrobium nobile]|uniref:Retrovirus-related Pol polyprotein from transposon TNT 1-94 n=1 Tax=Dendrobium nobile TaxID=94219 RepID=A0A8T3AE64_DENNO|nr:hypothetical protein KFK09_024809 [Dendrobium nobile]